MQEIKKPRIKPPHIALFCVALEILLKYFFRKLDVIPYPYNYFGIVPVFLGAFTMGWALYHFKRNDTPFIPGQIPTFVVTEGPYKYTRNPMYLGMMYILLGIAFFLGNLLSLLGPMVFFVAINSGFIPFEEKLMQKIFGKKYLEYKSRVRRWI